MRIRGVILTIFLITWQRARTHTREKLAEKPNPAANDVDNCRFHFQRSVSSDLLDDDDDNDNDDDVPDGEALSFRSNFTSMPNERLTRVKIGTWTALYNNYFSEDVGFVSRMMESLENDERREEFLNGIGIRIPFAANYCGGNRAAWPVLQAMAEDLIEASATEENALSLLLQNHPLLLSAPPNFLLKLKRVHKLFLLAYATAAAAAAADNANAFWERRSPLTRRSWSKILVQPRRRIVSFLKEWKNSGFFQILNTINAAELQHLLTELFADRTMGPAFFCSIRWNTVQIRKIVDSYYEHFNNSLATDEENCGKFLFRLLPVQIARAVQADAASAANHLQNVDQVSLPQALQLSKFFLTSSAQSSNKTLPEIDESNCIVVGKLLHSQKNSFLSQFYEQTLKMKMIKCLDSDDYSILQARYILGRNGIRDVNDYLLNLKGLIAAIPASYYFDLVTMSKRDGSLENHFLHVLKYFPSRANRIAASAAAHACKLVIDATRCIESVLENKDNEVVSTVVSPLDVRKNVDAIWHWLAAKAKNDNEFEQRVPHLPDFVLTELLRKKDLVISYDQLFNETYPVHLAIMGLNCEILSRIQITNFLPVFEFYNRQRRLYHKEFPKDLQKCAQTAFLSYLRMKSNWCSVAPLETNLLQYLDLADIRSIGGYVLTTLPANSIARSKHRRNIVEQIGRLSLPELMLATARSHLVSIVSKYLNDTATIETEHLITLGNLTHFVDGNYIRKIDASAFKFTLEAELIDTRICASSATRKEWADKLIEAFGSPTTWDEDDILKIGDLLIVINETSFAALNETAGSRAADLFNSKYKRFVEWIPRRLSFYEVCRLILPQTERAEYENSVTRLALFHAASIERLLGTVTVTVAEVDADERHRYLRAELPHQRNSEMTRSDDDTEAGSTADAAETYEPAIVGDNRPTTLTPTPTPTPTSTSTSAADDAADDPNPMIVTVEATDTRTERTTSPARSSFDAGVLGSSSVTGEPTVVTAVTSATTQYSSTETSRPTTATATATATPSDTGSRGRGRGHGDIDSEETTTPTPTPPTTTAATSTADTGVGNVPISTARMAAAATTPPLPVAHTDAADDDVANLSPRMEGERAAAVASSATAATAATVDQTSAASSASWFSKRSSDSPVTRNARNLRATAALFYEQTTAGNGDHPADADRDRAIDANLVADRRRNDDQLPPSEVDDVVRRVLAGTSYSDTTPLSVYRSKRDDNRSPVAFGCDTLKMLDAMAEFVVNLPVDRVHQDPDEEFECVETLARIDTLSAEHTRTIWSRVSSRLSDANLSFVGGRLLSAVSEHELTNFTSTYDVRSAGALELIGALSDVSHLWPNEMRLLLVGKIMSDNNGIVDAAQFPVFLRALGKLVCLVDSESAVKLLGEKNFTDVVDVYRWWSATHAFRDCPSKCLERIANVTALQYDERRSFRSLAWDATVADALGPIAAAVVHRSYQNQQHQQHQQPQQPQPSNGAPYLSAPAIACLLEWTSNDDRQHHQQLMYSNGSTNLSLSLSSAMLLAEKDCHRVSTYDNCPFTSSLAGVILAEDSLQLPRPAANSSQSQSQSQSQSPSPTPTPTSFTSRSTSSRANISRPLALSASFYASSCLSYYLWYLSSALLSNLLFHRQLRRS